MTETPPMKIENVELPRVRPSKTNPRKDFKEVEMVDLTESVRFKGILQPLLVRPGWCIGLDQEAIDGKVAEALADNGHAPAPEFYEIIAGERRYHAAERASLPTLPLIVRALSDQETLEIQLIENLQREDLDPFEEAEGYHRLLALRDGHDRPVHTIDSIHHRIGKDRSRIYRRLKLLGVPAGIRESVLEGNLAVETAEMVGEVAPAQLREAAAEEILHPKYTEGPLNRRQARELIADRYRRSLAGAPFDQADAELLSIIQDEDTGDRIGGGACTDCPMRTGNMEAIIGKTKRPDVCTNPRCYMMKCDAQFARLQTDAVKEGKKLVSESEAKEIFEEDGSIFFDSPFVKLTDRPDPHECPGLESGSKPPTWAKLLESLRSGPQPMSGPAIYISRDPRGRIVEIVDRKLAIEAVKLWHKQKGELSIFDETGRSASARGSGATSAAGAASETSFQKQERKKKEQAKLDLQVTLASLTALYNSIDDLQTDGFLPSLLKLCILQAGHDGCWLVCKWLKLEPKKDKANPNAKDFAGAIEQYLTVTLAGSSYTHKIAMMTCLLLSQRIKFNGVKDEQFKRFAGLFKIDTDAIAKSLKTERPAPETLKPADPPPPKASASVKTTADKTADASGKPARKLKAAKHRFERLTDNKYRCKNCGASAVKAKGKMVIGKEFAGKSCVASPPRKPKKSGKVIRKRNQKRTSRAKG